VAAAGNTGRNKRSRDTPPARSFSVHDARLAQEPAKSVFDYGADHGCAAGQPAGSQPRSGPDAGNWQAMGLRGAEDWRKMSGPGVKAGQRDASAQQVLRLLVPTPPQDYCAARISRRRVSGSCGNPALECSAK